MKIWHEGAVREPADCRVSVLDHGLLYGDGVFEGIRITARRIFRLDDHLARLARSARAIGLTLPCTTAVVRNAVIETARANDADEAYVRILLTRGEGELGVDPLGCKAPQLFCIVATLSMFDPAARAAGLRLMTAAQRRPGADTLDPQVKSLNYLNNVLAKRDARMRGYDDALLLNREGRVAEASGANIFAVVDDVVVTPPCAEGALGGITRDALLAILNAGGHPHRVAPVTRYDVLNASEVFLTGSGAGLVAVSSLDDTPIGDGERPWLECLQNAWQACAVEHGVLF